MRVGQVRGALVARKLNMLKANNYHDWYYASACLFPCGEMAKTSIRKMRPRSISILAMSTALAPVERSFSYSLTIG
jgi:hypothetical protein